MSRRIQIPTLEMGTLDVFQIDRYPHRGGQWETKWEPLRSTRLGRLHTYVTLEEWQHALAGFTRPLVHLLSAPPHMALRKIPAENRVCHNRVGCSLVGPECEPSAPKMPWCFEPGGTDDADLRALGAEIIALWREGVHVVVVDRTKE